MSGSLTVFAHLDMGEQHPDVPQLGAMARCPREDCPGEEGWEMGYGLAGGGCGAYEWCPTCERVVGKTQDQSE